MNADCKTFVTLRRFGPTEEIIWWHLKTGKIIRKEIVYNHPTQVNFCKLPEKNNLLVITYIDEIAIKDIQTWDIV